MLSISPFLVIDDNTIFGVIKSVQVNFIHLALSGLEIELWKNLLIFLKISEYGMNKFTKFDE